MGVEEPTSVLSNGASGRAAVSADHGAGVPWRSIGPHRGGRVVAVAGDPGNATVFYQGACAGGVWKTIDAGTYWENVSDGFFRTASVGAIAVAPSDPNVIYVGTGESTIRGNVSHGDGVYKSTDAGQTWQNVGLVNTRHISKIRIHPTNADLLYVAALGHAWGPNSERGVYRSSDGGRNWESILFDSDRVGAIDLSMDPTNPRILYAALWEAQRSPFALTSGGPGSGLYKSSDGGVNWNKVSSHPGFPAGVKGKIGVAVSPARHNRVWALVEAHDGALLRSDDGGGTWERVSEVGDLRQRAWYYMHVIADPNDADTVWVLNLQCWKSIDGGRTFSAIPTPHGDNHDLWIDPRNSSRMIEGNDGGACVSVNGGESWSTLYNQPTAQMYHVTTDRQQPYRIYGSQQDNSAIAIAGMSRRGAITQQDWYEPGGGESGYIAVDDQNPNIVYGGGIGSGEFNGRLLRYDHATGQERDITVWPDDQGMGDGADTLKYRFQWTFPVFLSRHEPKTLYVAANKVLRSRDEGTSWEEISPDLSRQDPSTLGASGGPITKDNTGAEVYGTIFSLTESGHEPRVLWAGSDDGLVHLTRDGGTRWTNVTPDNLPDWSLITSIEVSPHNPAGAYLCATRYKHDDLRPFLLKTSDFGQTWDVIIEGIPTGDFTRVLRSDPACPGLLFAGTETGLYVSFDDGRQWARFQSNLPVSPVHDLVVKDDDLIVATHGRSFWVLDDISPLRRLASADVVDAVHLFDPRPARRIKTYEGWGYKPGGAVNYRHVGTVVSAYRSSTRPDGTLEERWLDAGQNPPIGVIVNYFLAGDAPEDVRLIFRDAGGVEIRRFSSADPAKPQDSSGQDGEGMQSGGEGLEGAASPDPNDEHREPRVPAEVGLNRFVWNMRHPDARRLPGDKSFESAPAPVALPGAYQVDLVIGDRTWSASFEILPDARSSATLDELTEQFDLAIRIRDVLSSVHEAVDQIRAIVRQIDAWSPILQRREDAAEIVVRSRAVRDALSRIEGELVQRQSQSPLNPPSRLNFKLAALLEGVQNADAAPTQGQVGVFEHLRDVVAQHLNELQHVLDGELNELNQMIRSSRLDPISTRI
ncbi:MAG TPA: glycosyl hydrolase [Chloroflexota bacterium]